jgi:hydrogenase maturation factor
MASSLLPAGKLPADLLADLLGDLPTQDPQLLLGPTIGADAAVIDFAAGSSKLLVVKCDPITFATDEIGYYAVNVCANDLAVTGATPRFFMPTLLLPAGTTDAERARCIFHQIGDACRMLGVVVAGGHSEITHTVNQPIIAGAMLGEVTRGRQLSTRDCRPGDSVLMAGVAPVEGVSIIAREKRDELLARGWSLEIVEQAARFLHQPGISVLQPALAAAATGLVSAMHDPTEGGIATGLLELAMAARVGLEIDLDAIAVPDLARRLCAAFGLDPLGTIASGALLATAAPERAPRLLTLWQELGWPASVIGRATEKAGEIFSLHNGQRAPLARFAADEITKLWT